MANEEKAVVRYVARDGAPITLSPSVIKANLVSGYPDLVTNQEMFLYMGVCKSRGLNPWIRDCYLIKYTKRDPAAIIVSIDYYRKRARAQKDCKGWQTGIVILNTKNEIENRVGCIMLDGETLLGGWFEATPDGWNTPMVKTVNLKRYIKTTKEGNVTRFWSEDNQPEQIAKVAESQGLRATWPDEFQGLYVDAERESMDAQAVLDGSIDQAATQEAKEAMEETLGKPQTTEQPPDLPPAPTEDKTPGLMPEDEKAEVPPDRAADPAPVPATAPQDQGVLQALRDSKLYREFDPMTEEVGKRYAGAKLQKLYDELDKLDVPYAKSWSGAVLHMKLKDAVAPAEKDPSPGPESTEPDPAADPATAPGPQAEHEGLPAIDSLRLQVAQAKLNEPEIYRYAYANQLGQGKLRTEVTPADFTEDECMALLTDVNGQIDLRSQSQVG